MVVLPRSRVRSLTSGCACLWCTLHRLWLYSGIAAFLEWRLCLKHVGVGHLETLNGSPSMFLASSARRFIKMQVFCFLSESLCINHLTTFLQLRLMRQQDIRASPHHMHLERICVLHMTSLSGWHMVIVPTRKTWTAGAGEADRRTI